MTGPKSPSREPSLRLIHGGLHRRVHIGRLRLAAAPETAPPFEVEAVVEEEDTHLVLSAPVALPEDPEHPIRLMTALLEEHGEEPGSVIARKGRPLRLLAVVHDLSAEPTWREDWVETTLENVLCETGRRRICSLALPCLATRHGRLEPQRFVVLLRQALVRHAPDSLQRLWLIVPPGASQDLLKTFEQAEPSTENQASGGRTGCRA